MPYKFLTMLFVALCATPAAIAQDNSSEERIASFQKFISDFRDKKRIVSLSVAVTKDSQIIYNEGFGWQDHDAEERTTTDTSYLVASISKTFAAATLIAMDADGHISLDDDFTKLSDWQGRCEDLTSSRSIFGGGMLDNGTQIAPPNCDATYTLRHVLQHRVNGEPDGSFFYNPVIYGRLSNWIEEQTGTPFRSWMDKYVLAPANLNNIAAGWRHEGRSEILRHIAPPFRFDKTRSGRPVPSVLPNTELNASSGIIASAAALAEYSIALDQEKILSRALLDKMWTPPVDRNGEAAPYAYGWYVENPEDRKLVWHAGWWPDAYAGLILKIPEEKLTLVVLGNTDGVWWPTPLNKGGIEGSEIATKFLELF